MEAGIPLVRGLQWLPSPSWENPTSRALLKSVSGLTDLLSLSFLTLFILFSKSDSTFKVHFQAFLLQEAFLTKSSSLEFTLHSLTKYLLACFVCYTLC